MSYKSWPWKSNDHDRILLSDEIAEFFKGRQSNGVAFGLVVMPYNDMTIMLTDGHASINGRQFYSISDSSGTPTTLECGIANGTYSKYVSVFLRSTISARTIEPIVKEGTPSANPTVPAIQRDADVYELRLADILIPKGVTAITQDMIHNTIAGTECGVSVNQPTAVDTAAFSLELDTWLQLYKVAKNEEFETWFNAVKDVLDDNTAGNLYNAINQQPRIVIAESDQEGNPIFPSDEGTYIVIA